MGCFATLLGVAVVLAVVIGGCVLHMNPDIFERGVEEIDKQEQKIDQYGPLITAITKLASDPDNNDYRAEYDLQVSRCWIHCSDEVVRALNEVTAAFRAGESADEALNKLRAAMMEN